MSANERLMAERIQATIKRNLIDLSIHLHNKMASIVVNLQDGDTTSVAEWIQEAKGMFAELEECFGLTADDLIGSEIDPRAVPEYEAELKKLESNRANMEDVPW